MFKTHCPRCRHLIGAGMLCWCIAVPAADAPHIHNEAPIGPTPMRAMIVSTSSSSATAVGPVIWRVPSS